MKMAVVHSQGIEVILALFNSVTPAEKGLWFFSVQDLEITKMCA